MQIILLTHSRELSKKTNTGQLIERLIPSTQKIIWQRTQADVGLLKLIETGKTALVYPLDEVMSTETMAVEHKPILFNDFENFILIDSTWQEARKIYNRSAYLQTLPRVQLVAKNPSQYALRRNQVEGGLCTAECAIELLRKCKQLELADTLNLHFTQFVNAAK